MYATQTTTETQMTVTLSLIPVESTDLLNRLAEILEKFQSWNDDLSQRLFKWGSNAILLTAECEGMNINEFRTKVNKQLDRLEEILVNPLTHDPLQSPLLDREWVWENSILEDYLKLSKFSPFDGLPIAAKTHEFAVAMIDWLRALRHTKQMVEVKKREELVIGSLVSVDVPDKQRLSNYQTLANAAHAIKRLHILQSTCENVEQMYKKNAAQMRFKFREEEEKLQKRIEESEQFQNARLEIIKSEHQVNVELVKSQMGHLEKEKGFLQEQVIQATKSIQNLNTQIANLLKEQSKDKQEIQRLQGEVDDICVII